MTPDANMVVAAWRSDHPHHAVADAGLAQALSAAASGPAFTVMPMVLASCLRLVTNPKVFQRATPINEAMAFARALLSTPSVQLVTLVPEWPRFR